jgi:uncharacterized delta-60 repeat protein
VLALGSSSASSRAGTRGAHRGPSRDWAYGVVIQPDGKIVTAGRTIDSRGRWRFGLVRYTRSGGVDIRFGRNGRVATAFGTKGRSVASAVGLRRDGKFVVAGDRTYGGVGDGIAVSRYTARGRLDPSFGRGGKVLTPVGPKRSAASAADVAIQPDGKPVVVGVSARTLEFEGLPTLVRYTNTGRLDPRFGRSGKVVSGGTPGRATAVVLQPDGKIVTAVRGVGLTRYTKGGKLDTSFGQGGMAVTEGSRRARANALAIQPDGKLVAAGEAPGGDFALLRFTSNGSLDASFGSGGVVVTDFGQRAGCPSCGSSDESASAVVVQPDGKIVVAGWSDNGGKGAARSGTPLDDFALVRYEADGRLDRSFGRGGIVVSDLAPDGELSAEDVALQPNGAIVAVGGGSGSFVVARYRPDGQLDGTFGDFGRVTTNITP